MKELEHHLRVVNRSWDTQVKTQPLPMPLPSSIPPIPELAPMAKIPPVIRPELDTPRVPAPTLRSGPRRVFNPNANSTRQVKGTYAPSPTSVQYDQNLTRNMVQGWMTGAVDAQQFWNQQNRGQGGQLVNPRGVNRPAFPEAPSEGDHPTGNNNFPNRDRRAGGGWDLGGSGGGSSDEDLAGPGFQGWGFQRRPAGGCGDDPSSDDESFGSIPSSMSSRRSARKRE